MKKLIYPFTSKKLPELKEVGGKALSLMVMTQEKFPVPSGFVLAVDFFEPWFQEVEKGNDWKAFLKSPTADLKKHCDAVKTRCESLEMTSSQKAALNAAIKKLRKNALFAVRSSSPEEDLEGTSFAGGYETTLGVTHKTLKEAILHSFISVFDERIVKYKSQHKMRTDSPRIAVIVQEQIASEVSGVAFSLNPQNNCYDEAVINANFGLGETVVSGQVTPDTFIVDMPKRKILEKKIASKDYALWLNENGGTEKKDNEKPSKPSLTDRQAKEVAKLVEHVEKHYEKPMDIEWAYAKDKLYLLQARPVTAHFPLPESLISRPGEPKYLYVNMGLVKQGIPGLMSPMGSDIILYMVDVAGEMISEEAIIDPKKGIGSYSDGVMVTQVGNLQKMMGKRVTKAAVYIGGQSVVDTYESIDMKEYLPKRLPKTLAKVRWKMVWFGLKQSPEMLKAIWSPLEYLKTYKNHDVLQEKEHHKLLSRDFKSLSDAIDAAMEANVSSLMDEAAAIIAGARLAKHNIDTMFKKDDVQDLLVNLEMALPGNKTSEMGQMMYELAKEPEVRKLKNAEEFLQKIEARTFSKKFLKKWDEYMIKHGFRGMGELDIGNPRTHENLSSLVRTIKDMSEQAKHGGEDAFEKAERKREDAYKKLYALAKKKGPRKLKKFKKKYQVFIALAGLRENPKYNMVRLLDLVHMQALKFGEKFVKAKRLDRAEDIFKLTVHEVDQALKNKKKNLRNCIEKNTAYAKQLAGRDIPPFFDSRGKIFHPPVKSAGTNVFTGESIAPGRAVGRVKVLKTAHEKPVLPGEILVAKATDPGWTPLFINAGGIILENGGSLQHGAVVAREYGKPCVSSVVNATQILKDGQLIEVDGSSGHVRIINEDNPYMGQPAEWPISDPKAILARASIVELMPDPLTPLFETIASYSVVEGLEKLVNQLFKRNALESFQIQFPVINGYGYYQMRIKLWPYLRLTPSVFRLLPWMFKKSIPDWEERRKPAFQAVIDEWNEQKVKKMNCQKLLEGGEELTAKTMDYYTAVQAILPVIYMGEATFMWYYNSFVRRKNEPPFETYVMGYDSLPINADKSLYDIAMWCKKQKDLAALLMRTPNEKFNDLVDRKTAPKEVLEPIWKEWKNRFHEYLENYGHMIYDLDIAKAVPADAPEPLFGTMKYYMSGEGADPHRRQQKVIKEREAATKKIQKRLGFIRRYLFTKLLRFAQSRVPYREDGLADIGLAYPTARKLLLELGDRLRKKDIIEKKEDVFWLEIDELKKFTKQLDANRNVKNQQELVNDRVKKWEWQRSLTPPPFLPKKGWVGKMMSWYFPEETEGKKLEVLKGLGVSKGSITGTARVILGPDEFDQMQPGDILVTAITTPAWTPLFALASGVVTDVGGALSHSSIVAREYGIPAVLGTGIASKQIKSGQKITVDGDAGVVKIL